MLYVHRNEESPIVSIPGQNESDERQGEDWPDDDIMTPPTVLLGRALKQAEDATKQKEVNYIICDNFAHFDFSISRALFQSVLYCIYTLTQAEKAVKLWTKCAALSRVVYGDTHWEWAKCHIHLAKAYLDLRSKSFILIPPLSNDPNTFIHHRSVRARPLTCCERT